MLKAGQAATRVVRACVKDAKAAGYKCAEAIDPNPGRLLTTSSNLIQAPPASIASRQQRSGRPVGSGSQVVRIQVIRCLGARISSRCSTRGTRWMC